MKNTNTCKDCNKKVYSVRCADCFKIYRKSDEFRQKHSQATKQAMAKPENRKRFEKGIQKRVLNTPKGENSPLWKGGKVLQSQTARRSQEYVTWRKQVFKRDNYTCQDCGSKKNLHAHHIKYFADYPKLRFEVSNGKVVCNKCHSKIHGRSIQSPSVKKEIHNQCPKCSGKKLITSKHCRSCAPFNRATMFCPKCNKKVTDKVSQCFDCRRKEKPFPVCSQCGIKLGDRRSTTCRNCIPRSNGQFAPNNKSRKRKNRINKAKSLN